MPKKNIELEPLDLVNVMEIQKIREILVNHPDLLSIFELLILVCNKRINNEDQKKIN
jgi:hypothetical protein